MLTRETILVVERWRLAVPQAPVSPVRPSGLHLVTTHDLREMRQAVAEGRLPADFERKLCRLAGGSLIEQYVEQNSRLIFSLLVAERQGLFKAADLGDTDRLLRLLAYVRKDDDAIPDYRADGFKDDAQEIRALETELKSVLDVFKSWRLRHQVPGLWHSAKPRAEAC